MRKVAWTNSASIDGLWSHDVSTNKKQNFKLKVHFVRGKLFKNEKKA